MKNSKKLKLILMILISVLIILVGFIGIYVKKGVSYKNILPEYELASDLKGSTVVEFEVDDTVETKYYDKEGKEVDSSEVTDENKKNYTTEEIPVNSEENLNVENYKKSVEIMKGRLEFLQADQYKIDLDDKTGKIVLAFEDDYPDDIKSFLQMEGKFELIDVDTEDVVLTHNDFIKAEGSYASMDDGVNISYVAYINLKLNNAGLEKLNNIEKYRVDSETENTEDSNTGFKVMFDTEEIATISDDDILLNNKTLRITIAKDLTDETEINSVLNTNAIVSELATIGKMPVIYNITAEEYIQSNVNNFIPYIVIGLIAICIIIAIYFIIKYKAKGLLGCIAFAANIALFLIMIRLTSIQLSLNGFAGILGLILLNTILVNNILKCTKQKEKTFSENIKSAYLKTLDSFIVMLIILVVFAFSSMTVINSMGLLVFWGWIVILLGNLIFTLPLLSVASKK